MGVLVAVGGFGVLVGRGVKVAVGGFGVFVGRGVLVGTFVGDFTAVGLGSGTQMQISTKSPSSSSHSYQQNHLADASPPTSATTRTTLTSQAGDERREGVSYGRTCHGRRRCGGQSRGNASDDTSCAVLFVTRIPPRTAGGGR